MENSQAFPLCFLISLLTFHSFLPFSIAQLSPSESRILFQIQEILEYPEVFQDWTNWTNFCYLPQSQLLVIVCSDNHVTEFSVTGNKSSPSQIPTVSHQTLSDKFSIDSLFTVLTRLPNLKVLSLVSLGLWGPLPEKINRIRSLEVFNLSSNFIYGEIPTSISTMQNLTSLVLAHNLFNGSVPNLVPLQSLQELDLGNNQLGPTFPSLNTNIKTIILSNNSIRSQIPYTIKDFDLLHRLDVSFNKLVGPIPSPLFSLPSIQYLNLGHNQLTGALSPNISCNANLTFVDISRNFIIGNLPACLGSNSTNRAVLIFWNCLSGGLPKYQHTVPFCNKEALAVEPTVQGRKGEATIKLGLILGIVGGIVGAAGVVGFLVLAILRKAERGEGNKFKSDSFVIEKTSVRSSPVVDGRRVPQSIRVPALGLPPYHVFTLEDMEDATNNFDPSNLLREGSQGQLYKGCLRDGSMALIKCLKLKQKNSHQNLQQQMDLISKLRHRHLVSVLGHCIVSYQDHHPNTAAITVFIVLEHVSNGSLRDHLTDWRKREYLKWPERMGITMGIARGIQFLHTGIAPGVFGNDLKIENILLDDSLTARISSYNISLPSKVGSESPLNGQEALKSPGSSENPEKNDIYQLGIILLEVITGKPITSETESYDLKFQLEKNLAESPSRLREVIDPSILGTYAYESMKTAVGITLKCLSEESSERPTIEDVLWHLQYSIQVQEGWTSSGNLSTKF